MQEDRAQAVLRAGRRQESGKKEGKKTASTLRKRARTLIKREESGPDTTIISREVAIPHFLVFLAIPSLLRDSVNFALFRHLCAEVLALAWVGGLEVQESEETGVAVSGDRAQNTMIVSRFLTLWPESRVSDGTLDFLPESRGSITGPLSVGS